MVHYGFPVRSAKIPMGNGTYARGMGGVEGVDG